MPPAQRQTPLWLCLVLVGLILLQLFADGSSEKRQKPGPARGDLVLTEESLPAEIAGWKRTKFIPAPAPEDFPEGQFWWSHHWEYATDQLVALVAVDQCQEFHGWHELTYCYEAMGWENVKREIVDVGDSNWPVVVARFERDDGKYALVAFSLFSKDGNVRLHPPEAGDLDLIKGDFMDVWENRMRNARNRRNSVSFRESIQVQVVCVQRHKLTQLESEAVIDLHFKARGDLYGDWDIDR
jgi:hypothetical protein